MPVRDDDVDALYRLPLREFTAARNALAQRAGAQRAGIKQLEKPTASAWAINQLYWQRRATYDRLAAAAERLRATYRRVLSGKHADLAAAETSHREALKAAARDVRAILEAAGETASPQTWRGVTETLEALPGPDRPGRLVTPLRPLGFEALAGVVPQGGRRATPKAPVALGPAPHAVSAAAQAAAARRQTAARRRERALVERECRRARDAAIREEGALKQARQRLAAAERERAQLAERLDEAAGHVERRRTSLRALEQDASRAAAEQARLEAALAQFDEK
jgi:hypothetical protein